FKCYIRRRIEHHVPRPLLNGDDDHAKALPNVAVLYRDANQSALRLNSRLFNLQIDVFRLRGQLYEVDYRWPQHGLSDTCAADLIRRNNAVGAGAKELLLGTGFFRSGDDEQLFIEEASAHGDVEVLCI